MLMLEKAFILFIDIILGSVEVVDLLWHGDMEVILVHVLCLIDKGGKMTEKLRNARIPTGRIFHFWGYFSEVLSFFF